MKRRLVLTNESARHPFRQSIPAPVIDSSRHREPLSDGGLFTLTFVAALLAFEEAGLAPHVLRTITAGDWYGFGFFRTFQARYGPHAK